MFRDTASFPWLLRHLQGDEVSRCPSRAEPGGKRDVVERGTRWSLANIPVMGMLSFLTILQSVAGCHLFDVTVTVRTLPEPSRGVLTF